MPSVVEPPPSPPVREGGLPAGAGLSFHHLGLAVASPERASSFLRALGYELGPVVFDPLQRVNLVMATHPDLPAVEVIAPAGDDGPLASLLRKDAELVYHVCFATADREATLEALKRAGVRVLPVVAPTPAVLFGGRAVSFHRVAGFGLIELVSSEVGP